MVAEEPDGELESMNEHRPARHECEHLRAAWNRGERLSVESHLAPETYTSLLSDHCLELILTEFQLRQEAGETPEVAEYLRRFPELQERLQRLLPLMNEGVKSAAVGSSSRQDLSAFDATHMNPVASDGDSHQQNCDSQELLNKSPAIGPYKLLQQIGQGGMGSVFMAEQDKPVRRRVALKLIKLGMDSRDVITRFEAERQALAMMDHQNIAKVLDAGTTNDGRPYFVMELVNGIPITDYCDKFKLALNDRLDLFSQACKAIQHAHQKGIIHRDIKPSNVLVTQHDGVPIVKVIDFGLAKALQSGTRLTDKTMFTEFGQVVGTLQYMSPEQAELNALDVDTRSDVYSLGVLLYELLTGSTPIEKQTLKEMALDRVLAAIREQEPPRPSFRLSSAGTNASGISEQRRTDPRRLSLILKGDLDWIAMKALEKDRTRRYDSPAQLAEDVQRYLNSEAIIARPPSVGYRLQKTLRKHRGKALAAGTVFLASVVGLAGTTIMWLRATSAEQGALQEAKNARDAETKERLANSSLAIERDTAKSERDKAVAAEIAAEETLARSDYFLAVSRWEQNRVGEGIELLERIPAKHRHLEWNLARRQFVGGYATFFGHTNAVMCVAFSPDGSLIASAGADSTIRLWDGTFGEELRTLRRPPSDVIGYSDVILSIDFNSDGSFIASGHSNGRVQLWDVQTGKELQGWQGHSERVTSVRFSPDSTMILTGSADETVSQWQASTGAELLQLRSEGDPYAVTSIDYSPDGSQIVSGSASGSIKSWDAKSGFSKRTMVGHTSAVRCLEFDVSGRRLVSGSAGGTIKIWDSNSGRELRTLNAHTAPVTCVRFSPDQTQVVSASDDNTIRLWDCITGDLIRVCKGHSRPPTSVSFSPDGTRLVSGSHDKTLMLWNVRSEYDLSKGIIQGGSMITVEKHNPDGTTQEISGRIDRLRGLSETPSGNESRTLRGHTHGVNSIDTNRDGSIILSGSHDGSIRRWDVKTGSELRKFEGNSISIRTVGFSSDGSRIVSDGMDNNIAVWDAVTGAELFELKGHSYDVSKACFSPDGRHIASGSNDCTVKLWDALNGEEVCTFQGHVSSVNCVNFSRDGSQIVSAADQTIKIWSPSKREELKSWRGHLATIQCVLFSPDGERLLSGSDDNTTKLWDARTGEELKTLRGHENSVMAVNFSPDGTRIVSGSGDHTIKLWDAATGEELYTLSGHSHAVSSVRFSEDGQRIISGSWDSTIKIWDTVPRQEYRILSGHSDVVTDVNFSIAGDYLRTTDERGQTFYWHVQSGSPHSEIPESIEWFEPKSERSSDGRWMALVMDQSVWLVDLNSHRSAERKAICEWMARPKLEWHRSLAHELEYRDESYAPLFHAAWALKIEATDAWAYDEFHFAYDQALRSQKTETPVIAKVISEMLQVPRGTATPQLNEASAETVNRQVWERVKKPLNNDQQIQRWLPRMKDVCTRYPQGVYWNTLGIAEYRLANYPACIEACRKSLELLPKEANLPGPHLGDLAFLAMSHRKLGHSEEAEAFRKQFVETMLAEKWMADVECQGFAKEIEAAFESFEQ